MLGKRITQLVEGLYSERARNEYHTRARVIVTKQKFEEADRYSEIRSITTEGSDLDDLICKSQFHVAVDAHFPKNYHHIMHEELGARRP